MSERRIVCLKYKEGSTSETEVVSNVPEGVRFGRKYWWQINSPWRRKTPLGRHRLWMFYRGHLVDVNRGKPGAVIGVYDDLDPDQQEARHHDAEQAVGKLPK